MTTLALADAAPAQFQVINLVARLTTAPVVRATTAGTQVASLRLAAQRPRRDGKDQGADYVDVVVIRPPGRDLRAIPEQGRKVAVNGRLAHSEWTADDGSHRRRLEVIANTIDFLDHPANPDSEPETVQANA